MNEEFQQELEQPLDLQMLNELRALQTEDSPQDVIGELIDLLLSTAPPLLEKIRQAIADGDSDALYRSAHSLKGNCASMGAVVLAAQIKELELMGRQNQMEGASEKLVQVEKEYARAIEAVEQERGKK